METFHCFLSLSSTPLLLSPFFCWWSLRSLIYFKSSLDYLHYLIQCRGFPGGSDSKESACDAGTLGSIPGLGRSHGGEHDNPLQCSCLKNIPWTGKPGGLQSTGSQRAGHDWATKHKHTIQCKCYIDSCQHGKFKFCFLEFYGNFFLHIFTIWFLLAELSCIVERCCLSLTCSYCWKFRSSPVFHSYGNN